LSSRGHLFDIWSLRQPYDDRIHLIHAEITADRHYLPEYLRLMRVLRAPRMAAITTPVLERRTRDRPTTITATAASVKPARTRL
jgi:hypothetical protein